MKEHEIIIDHHRYDEKIVLDTLDIYQVQIIELYQDALNISNIKNLLETLLANKGVLTSRFLNPVFKDKGAQWDYIMIIDMVKKMLKAYHQKKPIEVLDIYRNRQGYFDPQDLTKKERGILTKILKGENKRLKKKGIFSRRDRKAYTRRIATITPFITYIA